MAIGSPVGTLRNRRSYVSDSERQGTSQDNPPGPARSTCAVVHERQGPIAVQEERLPRFERLLAAVHEDVLGSRADLQRVAAPHDDVGDRAGLEPPVPLQAERV